MEELIISRVTKALGLKRRIIGVKFLVFKKEFDQAKGTIGKCIAEMVNMAGCGERKKAGKDNLEDLDEAYAIGMLGLPEEVSSGRREYECGCYESFAIARQIYENRQFIPQKIYGIEIAPLSEMGDADLMLIMGTAKDIMRVMQGYVLNYGVAKNVLTTGNGGVADELIAKAFMNNDISISLLNEKSRRCGGYLPSEMGAAVPIHMAYHVMRGILETVNLTENNKPKKEILSRLNYPEELGFPIKMNYDYAIQGMEYQKYCEACTKEEKEQGETE